MGTQSPDAIASSSVSSAPTPMGFPAAIAAVIGGGRITKLEWNNPDTYGILRNSILMLHRDDQWHKWIVNEGDLLGRDWVIL